MDVRAFLRDRLAGRRPQTLLPLLCPAEERPLDDVPALWRDAQLPPDADVSLYVHVPFCERTCRYCKYPAAPPVDRAEVARYVDDLAGRIRAIAPVMAGLRFRHLYVGGGTVTVLDPDQLDRVLGDVRAHFRLHEEGERTVELNPVSGTLAHLHVAAAHGANRVSFGVQTLDEEVLAAYGRLPVDTAHLDALLAYARGAFRATNLDLLVGLAGQSAARVLSDLATLVALGPSEITCYRYDPVGGDHGGPLLADYRALAERIEAAHGADFDIAANENAIRLTTRGAAAFPERYSLVERARTSTLGLGTRAGSRIAGVGEYITGRHHIQLRRYPPGYEELQFAILRLAATYAVPSDAYAAAFGESFSERFGAASRALVARGVAELRPEGLVLLRPDAVLEAAIELLPDALCSVVAERIGRDRPIPSPLAELPPERTPVAGRPALGRFLARLLALPGESVPAIDGRWVSVVDAAATLAFVEEGGGDEVLLHLRPHDPSLPAFLRAGAVDVCFEPDSIGARTRARLGAAGRRLAAYEWGTLLDFLRGSTRA